jgi:multimeric flavodoxin WrbA
MKVLGLMGSSRRDGNTNDLLDVALHAAAEAGAEVEKLTLLDYHVHHILNCGDCKRAGECPHDDWPIIREKIFEADGLIWATPVYWYSVSGLTKVVLDRLCCTMYWYDTGYFYDKLKGKAAGVITTLEETPHFAQHMLGGMKMTIEYDFCKWIDLGTVLAYGGSRGTALKNAEAVHQARELGQRFAHFVKEIEPE